MASFNLKHLIHWIPSQGDIGCCASFAVLLAIEISFNTEKLSRLYSYYMSRKIDNRIGQHGVSLKTIFDSAIQNGIATDKMWPFYPKNVNINPSNEAHKSALNNKLVSYDINIEDFRDSLHQNIPIIIGLYTGRLFWKLNSSLETQIYKPVNNTDNRKSMDHAVVIIGYDDNLCGGSWIICNSFGEKWGDCGYSILPYECEKDIIESYIVKEFVTKDARLKISKFDK